MIEVWERPPCLVCRAAFLDREVITDMCGTCRRRMRLRHDADPTKFSAWLRHITMQVADAIRPTGKRPPYKVLT